MRAVAVIAVAVLTFAGCAGESASQADLREPNVVGDVVPKDYSAQAPDQVTVFQNVDQHPTIVRVCIDGVAFRTLSVKHSGLASPAVDRVPEWDAQCPGPGE